MTALIFTLMVVAGGAVLATAAIWLLTTRHLPRLGDRARLAWGVGVGAINIALGVAWFVENAVVWEPALFVLIGLFTVVASTPRIQARLRRVDQRTE